MILTKHLYLASPRGFCSGVKNALTIVDQALIDFPGRPIYVINEIVHNQTIVEGLKARGVIFTQDIEVVPTTAVVIFSAHGVTPQVREYFDPTRFTVLDATCPLVKKIHDEVKVYSANGYHIIYIGSRSHDEGKGVIAENPENITVVENASEVEQIPRSYAKYIILSQTTLNIYEVDEITALIKQILPNTETPDRSDICFATTSRQTAVKELAPRCQLFLVIGSVNSSNSQKLRLIAERSGCRAQLIDRAEEIKSDWLTRVTAIGIAAGASAPEHLVTNTIDLLTTQYGYQLI